MTRKVKNLAAIAKAAGDPGQPTGVPDAVSSGVWKLVKVGQNVFEVLFGVEADQTNTLRAQAESDGDPILCGHVMCKRQPMELWVPIRVRRGGETEVGFAPLCQEHYTAVVESREVSR